MRTLTHTAAVALLSILPFAASASVTAAAAEKKPHAVAQKVDREKNEASDQILRDAITELQAVKNRVHGAAKMYGGHRGKADEHIDAAIRELQAALKFDETREKK